MYAGVPLRMAELLEIAIDWPMDGASSPPAVGVRDGEDCPSAGREALIESWPPQVNPMGGIAPYPDQLQVPPPSMTPGRAVI